MEILRTILSIVRVTLNDLKFVHLLMAIGGTSGWGMGISTIPFCSPSHQKKKQKQKQNKTNKHTKIQNNTKQTNKNPTKNKTKQKLPKTKQSK